MSHVVEVGRVGYHFGSQFWVSEHLSAKRKHLRIRNLEASFGSGQPFTAHSWGPRDLKQRDPPHRRCCSRSSSGTLKTKRRLLRVRSICFLLLSEVSGTLRTAPVGEHSLSCCMEGQPHMRKWSTQTNQSSGIYEACVLFVGHLPSVGKLT